MPCEEVSCSYKEEEFSEEATFLSHTRTRKLIRSYLQDPTSELQQLSPAYKLRLAMSKSLQFQLVLILFCSQSEEYNFTRDKIHRGKYSCTKSSAAIYQNIMGKATVNMSLTFRFNSVLRQGCK